MSDSRQSAGPTPRTGEAQNYCLKWLPDERRMQLIPMYGNQTSHEVCGIDAGDNEKSAYATADLAARAATRLARLYGLEQGDLRAYKCKGHWHVGNLAQPKGARERKNARKSGHFAAMYGAGPASNPYHDNADLHAAWVAGYNAYKALVMRESEL